MPLRAKQAAALFFFAALILCATQLSRADDGGNRARILC
jgi:hypothetical protein